MQKKNVVSITLLFSLNSCLDWGRKPVENKDSDLPKFVLKFIHYD